MNTLKSFRSRWVYWSILRCLAFHFTTDSLSGGSLGGHHRDPTIWRQSWSKSLCSDYSERKGMQSSFAAKAETDETNLTDHVWYPASTTGSASNTSISTFGTPKSLCTWPSTYKNTALCVPGNSCDPDEWMEECCGVGRFGARQRCRESCLYPWVSQSPAGRGHRRAQDQLDCTWAERHQPTGICVDITFARVYENQSLMHHTRKMSSMREHRSY